MTRNTQPAPVALSSRILFIGDSRATDCRSAEWAGRLRTAGLDTTVLRTADAPTRAAAAGDARVAIGDGTGTATAYRFLISGSVRAAVLLNPVIAPVRLAHGPVLLIDTSTETEAVAEQLRSNGICDRCLVNVTAGRPDSGDEMAEVADYIRDWLDFHRLLAPKHDTSRRDRRS